MESIDSNPATIGCQPNILQSLPGGYRRRRRNSQWDQGQGSDTQVWSQKTWPAVIITVNRACLKGATNF